MARRLLGDADNGWLALPSTTSSNTTPPRSMTRAPISLMSSPALPVSRPVAAYRLNASNYWTCSPPAPSAPSVESLAAMPFAHQSCSQRPHTRLMRQLLLHCLFGFQKRNEYPWPVSTPYRMPRLPTLSAISACVGMPGRRAINSCCVGR